MIGQNGVSVIIGHNGIQDKTTLNPANETVAKGIYDETTLSAVDADLAVSNIKSGITMFGFAGVATVQDIADADAVLADVKNGKTFYSVTGGRKTGNLATVSLSAAANSYPAGYHAGDTSLTAVDADLATANIKSGVTIFGVTGSTDVRDSTDADLVVAEAPTGKTFYAGGGARKTGTGTKTLSSANETVTAGYYAATTLSAVDTDLAVGNIKSGVTIFGKLGTYEGEGMTSGLIVMWHGLISNIPAGFVICDGNSGTPNLLAKFVQGVATAATDPGDTGGATSKTTSGHQHEMPIYIGGAGLNFPEPTGTVYGTGESKNSKANIAFIAGSESSRAMALVKSKTDAITDIRPLYYDIAFLMKT